MYKLLTSTQQASQLMYEFGESEDPRRLEQTNNKEEKGTYFVRIKLTDLFGLLIKTINLCIGLHLNFLT